jgi:hypothetical protein
MIEMKTTHTLVAFNIRIDEMINDELVRLASEKYGSKNEFILQAILEKLQREESKNRPLEPTIVLQGIIKQAATLRKRLNNAGGKHGDVPKKTSSG